MKYLIVKDTVTFTFLGAEKTSILHLMLTHHGHL